jgi:hypothetical protein
MTAKPKPDDKAQSERFIETARKVGADHDTGAADEVIGRLVKQPPEPRKPSKPESEKS